MSLVLWNDFDELIREANNRGIKHNYGLSSKSYS